MCVTFSVHVVSVMAYGSFAAFCISGSIPAAGTQSQRTLSELELCYSKLDRAHLEILKWCEWEGCLPNGESY